MNRLPVLLSTLREVLEITDRPSETICLQTDLCELGLTLIIEECIFETVALTCTHGCGHKSDHKC